MFQVVVQFFGGDVTRYHDQPLFLTDNMQARHRSGSNKSGNTGNLFNGDVVLLQLVVDVVDGRVKTRISLGHNYDVLSLCTEYFAAFIYSFIRS